MSYKSAQDVDDNISQTIQDSAKVYERQIGNRIQAFEWHQFQWPRVTADQDFKATILFDVKKLENGTR